MTVRNKRFADWNCGIIWTVIFAAAFVYAILKPPAAFRERARTAIERVRDAETPAVERTAVEKEMRAATSDKYSQDSLDVLRARLNCEARLSPALGDRADAICDARVQGWAAVMSQR